MAALKPEGSRVMPPFPFTAPQGSEDSKYFDMTQTNTALYNYLARSTIPDKALLIAMLAAGAEIYRLTLAHFAVGGGAAPAAVDRTVWMTGAVGPPIKAPDPGLAAVMSRLDQAINASCQRNKITTAPDKKEHRLTILIEANQLLTLSLTEGCSQHELLQHICQLPSSQRNRETFGFLTMAEVTGSELLTLSYFDLYVAAFRSVQSRTQYLGTAGTKIFDLPDLSLSFQDHLDSTRLLFDDLATYVKTHGLDTTAKLLEHFKAN